MSEEYLRFLNLLNALDGPLHHDLDTNCTKLLETICIDAYLNKKKHSVNELLNMRALGSQASIHKRLHTLVDKNYVTLEIQEDARIKKVTPTKEAKKFFSRANNLLISIFKS